MIDKINLDGMDPIAQMLSIRPNQGNGPQAMRGRGAPPIQDIASISSLGTLITSAQEQGGDTLSDLKDFMGNMHESFQSGDFDVDNILSNASDSIMQLSEENGIDLEQVIGDMASFAKSNPPRANGMPPGPPMGGPGGPNGSQKPGGSGNFMDEIFDDSDEEETDE